MSILDKDYKITVDMQSGYIDSDEITFASRDMNVSNINVEFIREGKPVNISGFTFIANIQKPDTLKYPFKIEIIDASNGLAKMDLPMDFTFDIGTYIVEIEMCKDKEISHSYTFEYNVREVLCTDINETIPDDAQYNLLMTLVSSVDRLETEVKGNEVIRVTSEKTRVSNENSRITNDTNRESRMANIERRFENMSTSQQQSSEVIDAREGMTSLKANLNRIETKAKEIFETVDGTNLSINDTNIGYMQNIEILGNTIQGSNLSDIKSVGDRVEAQELYEIPLLSVGKNLFNGAIEQGSITPSGEDTTGSSDKVHIRSSGFIRIKNSSDITISGYKGYDTRVFYYDVNKVFMQYKSVSSDILTVPDNAKYIRFRMLNCSIDSVKIQLEEGTQATTYEPYIEDKLTILSPVQLEKVGDVADRIVEKDGVWGVEKNVSNKTIKGNILSNFGELTNTIRLNCNAGEFSPLPKSSDGICNVLENDTTKNWDLDEESFYVLPNGTLVIKINKSKASNKVDGQKWVDNNSLVVKYATTQPTFIPLPHTQQVKLRTFANKTNIFSLCEIEPTIKGQVAKSIGATVNTHTTQIDGLYDELDRVKKLEQSTVTTVTADKDFVSVQETTQGYFEDVELKGRTEVNKTKYRSGWNNGNTYAYIGLDVSMLEVGKTYTIIPYGYSSNVGQFVVGEASASNPYFPKQKIGVIKFACPKISTSYHLFVYPVAGELVTNDFSNIKVVILEGDHTQNPPSYFEGLKSVGEDANEIVVSSVNGDGNLFDGELEQGLISSENGTDANNANTVRNKNMCNVSGGYNYYLSNEIGIELFNVYFYDNNKNYISYLPNVKTFKTPSNCKYIRFTIYKSGGLLPSSVIGVSLYKGTTQKPYEQHETDKKQLLYYDAETQTWKKPILREFDTIEKHSDGKYYYHVRSGQVVLNGSENDWSIDSGGSSVNILCFKKNILNATDNIKGICDKFNVYIKNELYSSDIEGIITSTSHYGGLKTVINIAKSKLNTQDLTGFKAWLQANNVTVVYQLATEKVYECTNIDLITYENETNYIVNSGAISPKTTLKVHSNISNVVGLLQKKISLLESSMSKYMITQNRLQLASTYSADSVTFKVDYIKGVDEQSTTTEYDNDLYDLILNNILVGKDNYNYDRMFDIIMDYASWKQITWEQFDILVGIMDMQYFPPNEETPQE